MTEEQNIIDLRQIVKRFYVGQPNELEILHSIDLQVKKGEFVSIVGASGSGKTTLMNIIGVLGPPHQRGLHPGRCGCCGRQRQRTVRYP